MALRGLRRGAARRRPRADHDRGRAGGALLLRRGLPPAVPAQGAERLLRPRRHRRLLPDPDALLGPRPPGAGEYHPAPVTPSFGSYIGGCLAVIGIVSAVGLGGYWLRRWIAPEFSGALARLADATIAVALLILSLELLGTLSILTLGWTVLVCIGGRPARRLDRLAQGLARGPRSEGAAGADDLPAAGDRGRLVHRRRVDLPVAAQPRQRHVRRRHHLVPHALRGADRPGRLDRPPPLHRSAAARRLVLPAELGARPRRRHRPLQERLALAAAQPGLALDRAARRLVRRPPLQGRPGDPGRRRDRPRRRGDDRDPARRGPQRHHGPRLPARLRRLPDQRPPAKSPGRGGRGAGRPRARRPASRQGPAGDRRHRRRPRRLGQVHVPDPGRRDHDRRRLLQRQGTAPHHRLGRSGSRPSWSAATGTCGRCSRRGATRSPTRASGRCTCRSPTRCRSTRGRASPSPTT